MDRNSLIGLTLITILLIVYFQVFVDKPPVPNQENQVATPNEVTVPDSPEKEQANETAEVTDPETQDSLKQAELLYAFDDLAPAAEGEEKQWEIKTDLLTVNLSNKGGRIVSAYLNEHKTFDGKPLPIITDNPENDFSFTFSYKRSGRAVNSNDLFFEPVELPSDLEVNGADSIRVVMRAKADDNRYIDQIYTFKGDTYDLGYEISMKGMREDLKSTYYALNWVSHLPKTELSITNMRQKSTIAYSQSDDTDKLSISDDRQAEDLRNGFIKWVSYKSQFFTHVLIADQSMRTADMAMTTPQNEEINRVMSSMITVDIPNREEQGTKFKIYMGPLEYNTLKAYDVGLQKSMDLGWWIIRYVNIFTVNVFNFLEKSISNYGIIIIILAFIFRLIVFPFTYKSHTSMAKMRVINQTDEIKSLDEKFKDDPQKLQMEKMKIYNSMGVSLFGGCLPMLFSYPFLIALFFFFPQSVELRQQSFLWANDLSTYDSILELPFKIPAYGDHVSLFTLLMAISTFIYTWYQQKSQPATGANAQMKYIAYIMPVVLLIFLNNYASGLSLYYLTSNIITILQTTTIRRFVNDEKLLADMRAVAKNKKKGKKGKGGGGGQPKSRLEKWVENQQKKQQGLAKQQKQTKGRNRRERRS